MQRLFLFRHAATALAAALAVLLAATPVLAGSVNLQSAGLDAATPASAPTSVEALHAAGFEAESGSALPAQLDDFDDYVNNVLEAFDVPGISVAIIKDGKVVLEQGYGVREKGVNGAADKPATARTLYAIASNTKAFTAASLSMLADQGKLDMGDRVVEHLPWFRMSDPYITQEMRVRDLLSHRSGLSLGAGDLLYWPTTDYSTREVVERLARVPVKHGFRERYFYDNILFGVAQLVVENVSGQDFRAFLNEHFFQPLGMTDTRFNFHDLTAADTDVATGYAKYDFKDLKPTDKLAWANNSGAGGIYSSVHDMSKWIAAQLAGGVYGKDADGKEQRLFSEARQREMWSVQTPIHPSPSKVPELAALTPTFSGYGEGWVLSEYRGRKLVYHTGGWPGFVSRVTLVPAENLGMVVLTNQESGSAFQSVTYRILDAYLGAEKNDWIAAFQAGEKYALDRADSSWQKHLDARDKRSKPSLPLAAYAGSYTDPWYGNVDIRLEGRQLVMQFARTKQLLGDLEHWQHDTFLVRWRDRSLNADAFATFALDEDGRITGLGIKAASPRTDFSFDFQDLRLTPTSADEP